MSLAERPGDWLDSACPQSEVGYAATLEIAYGESPRRQLCSGLPRGSSRSPPGPVKHPRNARRAAWEEETATPRRVHACYTRKPRGWYPRPFAPPGTRTGGPLVVLHGIELALPRPAPWSSSAPISLAFLVDAGGGQGGRRSEVCGGMPAIRGEACSSPAPL